MREAIGTGKTVEEATAAALAELGLSEEEVTVEVIDLPQKRFLKTIPAKVRVTVDADLEKESETPAAQQAPAAPAAQKPQTAPAAKAQTPQKPAGSAATQAENAAPTGPEIPETPVDLEQEPKVREAVDYLTELCHKMGAAEVELKAVRQGENIIIKVDGQDAGSLIGHRGEVMEALGYLTSLVANRTGGDYAKISLDINHYRAKREANLEALARRIGAKVARSGRSHTLEPMNPYERRIIHSAISTMENVKSESTGEGANRRVMILCTGPNAKQGGDRPFRQADRRAPRPGTSPRPGMSSPRNGAGRSRGPRSGFDRKPSTVPMREYADRPRDPSVAPTVPNRTETVNDGADLPLYGKIEL